MISWRYGGSVQPIGESRRSHLQVQLRIFLRAVKLGMVMPLWAMFSSVCIGAQCKRDWEVHFLGTFALACSANQGESGPQTFTLFYLVCIGPQCKREEKVNIFGMGEVWYFVGSFAFARSANE